MTRARTPRPQAQPLAVTLRAALAQGWHTLDALEALAGRVPAARHRVHAALAELRAGGCALEERVTRGVAEVRLAPATLPAPVPDDHRADLAATIVDLAREAAEMGVEDGHEWASVVDSLGLSEEEAERMRPVWTSAQDAWRRERVEGERASAAPPEPAPRLDAPAPPCEPSAPVEAVGGPVARATGPGSRCAECNRRRDLHHPADAHPFAPKPRGRPRVAAAPPSPPLDAAAPAGESAEPETSRDGSDAEALYTAIKAAGLTYVTLADGSAGNASDAPVYMATNTGPQCPSVWRGVRCEREAGHPCGSDADPGRHHETADRDAIWTDEAAARWAAREQGEERETPRGGKVKRTRAAIVGGAVVADAKPAPCRPPACHADDIHEPARVRSFQRPLCERHRRWVEGAGGTVATGATD